MMGNNGIKARKGITTDFNNIYWVKPIEKKGNNTLVENALSNQGHQVLKERFFIENELLFPLARGQDIHRFKVDKLSTALILPQDGMRSYSLEKMSRNFPLALKYFNKYETEACIGCAVGSTCNKGLKQRGSYSNPKYQNAMGDFYAIWNVGKYTFSQYKVVWKEISSKFEAAVIGSASVGCIEEKTVIADHKLMLYPCDTKEEAHYYCGMLNSTIFKNFAEAVGLSTSRGARIFEKVSLPSFDSNEPLHVQLSNLSIQAHEEGFVIDDKFEEELNEAVSAILGSIEISKTTPIELIDPLISKLRDQLTSVPLQISGGKQKIEDLEFVAIDLETTGFGPISYAHRIVEIGAVRFKISGIEKSWESKIWPLRPISKGACEVHGLSSEDLNQAPLFRDVLNPFLEFCKDSILVFHNAPFDLQFLLTELLLEGKHLSPIFIDTLQLLRNQFTLQENSLIGASDAFGIQNSKYHSALSDASTTAQLFIRLIEILKIKGQIKTLNDLLSLQGGEIKIGSIKNFDNGISNLQLEEIQINQLIKILLKNRDTYLVGKYLGAAIGEKVSYISIQIKEKRIHINVGNIVEISLI